MWFLIERSWSRGCMRFELDMNQNWVRATGKHSCLGPVAPASFSEEEQREVQGATQNHIADASVQTKREFSAHISSREPAEGHSRGNVLLRGVLSSTHLRWQCQTWWICEDALQDAFREDTPESWQIFRDPDSRRPFWWHEKTGEWFRTRHVAETEPEGNLLTRRV